MLLSRQLRKKEAGEDFFAKVSVNRLYGINNNLKADLVYDNHIITRKEGQEIANGLILTKINEDNIVVKKRNNNQNNLHLSLRQRQLIKSKVKNNKSWACKSEALVVFFVYYDIPLSSMNNKKNWEIINELS